MDLCSKCGEPLTPGSKYCPKCGALVTTLPASFTSPPAPDETAQQVAAEPEVPPEIAAVAPDPIPAAAPVAEDIAPQPAPAANPWSGTQDSIISSARYRKLNFGERLFTFIVVVLFASVVASVFTASIAFISTFTGDPFSVKPILKGWRMNIWDDTPAFQVATVPATAPTPAAAVTTPITTTDPIVQTKALPQTRTAVSFQSRGMGAREASRSQARLFAALKGNMEGINSAWDKVLTSKPDWPSSAITLQMTLDQKGKARSIQVVSNHNVPKVVQDEVLNAIQNTDFGRATIATTTVITFRFEKK
jgi:hypothetical protein